MMYSMVRVRMRKPAHNLGSRIPENFSFVMTASGFSQVYFSIMAGSGFGVR
jgi:hypothetical protein